MYDLLTEFLVCIIHRFENIANIPRTPSIDRQILDIHSSSQPVG